MNGHVPGGEPLPDFGEPVPGSSGRVFVSAQRPRRYLAVASNLRLRSDPHGAPGLTLTYIRGANPLLPPPPYALLELRFGAAPPHGEALAAVRRCEPGAVVEPVSLVGGWLRWAIGGEGAPHGTRGTPFGDVIPLAWNELGWSRQSMRLDPSQADLMGGSLRHGGVALYASAWVTVRGLPPRPPVTAVLDPGQLLRSRRRADGLVKVRWSELVADCLREVEAGRVVLNPERGRDESHLSPRLVAEALADGLGTRYGRWVAPEPEELEPHLLLQGLAPPEGSGGRTSWQLTLELSHPSPAIRLFQIDLDPLSEARALLGGASPEGVVRSVQVPPLDTGQRIVRVYANLPSHREGVLQVGATLAAPSAPPHRVDSIQETVRFQPPEDAGEARLRFAPGEPGAFTVTPFMTLRWGHGVAQLQGDPVPGEDGMILQPGDFPARFIQVQADPELLELAEVEVIHHRGEIGGEVRLALAPDRTAVALPLPLEADAGELTFRAVPGNGRDPLSLGPIPADSTTLGLHSFTGYGLHEVAIQCVAEDGVVVGVDLLPEAMKAGPTSITTLSFPPQRRERRWSYLALSPFHPGFRWRSHRPGQSPDEGWSEPEPPFHPLRLTLGPGGLKRTPGGEGP